MRETLVNWCRLHGREDLLEQWDLSKNEDLSPKTISYGSKKRVWWRCEKGHEWQVAVYGRTGGAGCPYCTGKKVWPGENDLASRFPALAAQWHPEKNLGLNPSEVLSGSHRMVWWCCEKGHEWLAQIKSRSNGAGCPICANRYAKEDSNDLSITHPELVTQWHPEKNGSLRPSQFVSGTSRKVWWQCGKGHEWQASISSRAHKGSGCPYCSGKAVAEGENDLATLLPTVAAQWHSEKNGSLQPGQVTAFSNRKVWWKCDKGHEWQAVISSRSDGRGCPVCTGRVVLAGFNDLATIQPKIAAQWCYELNGALTPEMVTAGSSKRAWWRCDEGHVWRAVVSSRTGPRKTGCPVCAGNVKKIRYRKK